MKQVYYNVYDYGRLVGTFATMDIQTMLHCSRQVPEHCTADGKAYRGRYTFIRLGGCGNVKTGDLASEWDKTRLRILHGLWKGGNR